VNALIDVDLNDVALLVRVVQRQSFSAAARERGVPVSTVSRRIARLEAVLGMRLLERTTRRLRLTDAGRAYFAHAERAVDDLALGTDRVRELQTEPRGRVRIVAPPPLGGAVANAVCTYLVKHPHVAIELELAGRQVDLLDEGFDLAIVTGRVDDSSDFIARELWQSSRKLLYASPRYLDARRVPRRVEDLARHDCLAGRAVDGLATWTLVANQRRKRFSFQPRFSVNESAAVQRAVIAGLGIALMPEVYCKADVAAKRLVRVLDRYEGEVGGVSLLYRAHRSLTAAVRSCIEHFVEALPGSDPARTRNRG
jgi:DNA-binding transcriptional LysR family regulator